MKINPSNFQFQQGETKVSISSSTRIIRKKFFFSFRSRWNEERRDSRRKREDYESPIRVIVGLVGPVLEGSSTGTRALGRRHRSPSNVGGHGTSNIAGIESRRKWKINMYSTTSRCLVTSEEEEEEDSAGYSRATPLLSLGSLRRGARVYSNWTFPDEESVLVPRFVSR